jgi:hypothetical protein
VAVNKKVLIISPYFPPVNAADMQRVRMSLSYFKEFGWDAEVVTVDPSYTDLPVDPLLCETIPPTVKIHYVKALNKIFTSKIGLGSIALRSLPYYWQYVNRLLRQQQYNLIYFSTTQFPVCWLGVHWKKKFGVPYVIDIQDPWHTDYYSDKPKAQRPPKYWFSYRLNQRLERPAMEQAGGLISVSETYIETLQERYPVIKSIPKSTITFGAFAADMDIARRHANQFPQLLAKDVRNIVYIGRGGSDMYTAIGKLFAAFKYGLEQDMELFSNIRIHFIGTSYAPKGLGVPSILPLAKQYDLEKYVVELTDRISFYHSLATLNQADVIFIPGSDAPGYTASKIYPYLLSTKPLLAIFTVGSPALPVLHNYGVEAAFNYEEASPQTVAACLKRFLIGNSYPVKYSQHATDQYSARTMTAAQCNLFNQVINEKA